VLQIDSEGPNLKLFRILFGRFNIDAMIQVSAYPRLSCSIRINVLVAIKYSITLFHLDLSYLENYYAIFKTTISLEI